MREEMRERDLTAYCGLYCGDCIRYQSRSCDLAKQLLKELGRQQFSEYAKLKSTNRKEFEHYDLIVSGLKAISELKCELPCRLGGDGCEGSCEIIKCIKDNTFEGCWECDSFEKCKKLDFLKPFHGNAPINNLRKIKELGIGKWAKHREKCYPWL
jgi:hypothetical protein